MELKLPYDIGIEKEVLGSLIAQGSKFVDVAEVLNENCFYDSKNKVVFNCIKKLFDEVKDINMLTVGEEAKRHKDYSEDLDNYIIDISINTTVYKLKELTLLLKEYLMRRNLLEYSFELQKRAGDLSEDIFSTLDFSSKVVDDISMESSINRFHTIKEVMVDSVKEIEEAEKREGTVIGVPSGFKDIDSITSGWNPSDLVIIAARPGMGKSTFARTIILNAALKQESNVVMFSLEENKNQIGKKFISFLTEIPFENIKTGNIKNDGWEKIHSGIASIENKNIIIDDTAGLSVFELKSKCRKINHRHKLDLVVVDYLQLMVGEKHNNREQEISYISRNLKGLAKELNVPVIALSQLSRAVEQRQDKKPMLSDLRESGAIEQDADIVSFLYRPEYYNLESNNGENLDGKAKFIIAKHRSGKLGEPRLLFDGAVSKFKDYEEDLLF